PGHRDPPHPRPEPRAGQRPRPRPPRSRPPGPRPAQPPPGRRRGRARLGGRVRPFVLAMAWRESRASLRRMALLLASIGVGVAALVAISSFTDSLQESVREQARALLGADLVLGSANRFSPPAERELQKIVGEAPRAEVSRLVRFAAMAYVPRTAGTRLVQVTAAEGGYPFYGHIETSPPGLWERP